MLVNRLHTTNVWEQTKHYIGTEGVLTLCLFLDIRTMIVIDDVILIPLLHDLTANIIAANSTTVIII